MITTGECTSSKLIHYRTRWLQYLSVSEPPVAVILLSTLKQGSLCPGDGGVTFTCTSRGTDLTWIVGGRMMSYNRNALVGAVRSNADSDETAILLRVDRLGDDGLASRVSVLTIRERPHVTQPVTVQCHNGSASQMETRMFWQKVAGLAHKEFRE